MASSASPAPSRPPPLVDTPPGKVPPGNFTQERFEQVVESTQEFIRSGDIIQVVPSQRFLQPFKRPALDLYRALRTVNPSPYTFILETGEYAIVGRHGSPRPADGRARGDSSDCRQRKRGTTPAEDLALEKELLADEKERAEHLMLVDLARNDIGRVCAYGSVHVPEMMVVERYSHVMHIVSQVEGTIAPEHTPTT